MMINNICPLCGDLVSVRDNSADYIVRGKGRFAVKQLLHHKCVERRQFHNGKKNIQQPEQIQGR